MNELRDLIQAEMTRRINRITEELICRTPVPSVLTADMIRGPFIDSRIVPRSNVVVQGANVGAIRIIVTTAAFEPVYLTGIERIFGRPSYLKPSAFLMDENGKQTLIVHPSIKAGFQSWE